MRAADLAFQRDKYKHLSDAEWRWMLQQVEGRERTADKLPTFASIEDWWYPVRLSCEQCSSELTARYKALLVQGTCSNGKCLDLTGGYGVDTYFLSEHFAHTDYVEQNEELCRIAAHNFYVQRGPSGQNQSIKGAVSVHNSTAEEFLLSEGRYDLIFLDPARRDSHGGKVFRMEDCAPNVVELLPSLLSHLTPQGRLMLKLSPMLDLRQAVTSLSQVAWDIHVVAVKNEVKEVLLLSGGVGKITAIDLTKMDKPFLFTREEERDASSLPFQGKLEGAYLYEPNVSILKSGAYKLVGERFGLHKLDVNTHLYCSETLVPDFPGRVWQIKEQIANRQLPIPNANVLVRNYPLTPDQLKKKLHLRDGGTAFIVGCRISGKPTLFHAERCV